MKLTYIKEGTTDLMVPLKTALHKKGPGTKSGVFFNPVMEFSRDVSIQVMKIFLKNNKAKLLDGLAGTGARGVRIANEVRGNFEMVINDHNPLAFEIIEKNMTLNGLDNHRSENQKLNTLLSAEGFDYVDVDPFGSPVEFLDASLQSLRNFGILAVTATDTAPLCGRYQKTCLRRYDAQSTKAVYSKEAGARILAGCCVKTAAKYDLALSPILTFFSDHYIRIHFKLEKGAKKADLTRRSIGFITHDLTSGEREVVSEPPEITQDILFSGPMWTGDLHNISFLSRINLDPDLGTSKKIEKLLSLWKQEAQMPPYFYEANEIASLTRTQPKSLRSIIEKLKDCGYSASRTHFSPNGFKTEAGIEDISQLIGNI